MKNVKAKYDPEQALLLAVGELHIMERVNQSKPKECEACKIICTRETECDILDAYLKAIKGTLSGKQFSTFVKERKISTGVKSLIDMIETAVKDSHK